MQQCNNYNATRQIYNPVREVGKNIGVHSKLTLNTFSSPQPSWNDDPLHPLPPQPSTHLQNCPFNTLHFPLSSPWPKRRCITHTHLLVVYEILALPVRYFTNPHTEYRKRPNFGLGHNFGRIFFLNPESIITNKIVLKYCGK